MAYQTSTTTDIAGLLSKLAEFAQSLGWTVNKLSTTALFVNNAQGYWAIEYKSNLLYTIAATGFDNSKDCFSQPGASCNNTFSTIKTATSQLGSGNYVSYDFFGTAQYLHIVIQVEAEKFRHFGVGTLDKEGEYIGGQYAFGTYLSNSYLNSQYSYNTYGFSNGGADYQAVVRADGIGGGSKSPWYFAPYSVSNLSTIDNRDKGKYLLSLGRASFSVHVNTYHPDRVLVEQSQSRFGQALIPCPHSLIAHGIDGVFRRLGVVPDRYECTMVGIQPRQILTINDERWMIIPSAGYDVRNETNIESGKNNSGIQGVAYRMIE